MKNLYLFLITIFFTTTIIYSQNQPFITTWEVTSSDLNITVPIYTGSTYNYTVDFGDGTVLNNQTGSAYHSYSNAGTYTVSVSGTFPRVYFAILPSIERHKIKSVEQWGDNQWQSMESAFKGCVNLVINATDAPDLSQATDMTSMFEDCDNFNHSINHWDVSTVTSLWRTFKGASSFNQPLNNWDVSNVTDMRNTFQLATSFNQPLHSWDVSNVTYTNGMFNGASSFNQPIGDWDVSSLTSMSSMFKTAVAFNQPIGNWDVSHVNSMAYLFSQAFSFNQPIENWDVSNVLNMSWVFSGANSFNQPVGGWNISNVTNMQGMFAGATLFNQSLDDWDVSNVTDMATMFYETPAFNQDISNWNFNQGIVFHDTISGLLAGFLEDSGLDVENYDLLLARFVSLNLNNKNVEANGLEYCDVASRDYLVNVLGWDIDGDSQHANCSVATENLIANNLVIYPNPTQSVLNIELRNNQHIEAIKIYNLNGLELLSLKDSSEQVSLENLSSGVYFVQIKTNEGIMTKRVIKN